MMIGQVLISATVPIDNFFAFTLVDGSVAVLNYANRLILGALAVIAIALQRAGLPILTRTYFMSEAAGRKAVVRWTIAAMAMGCALAAVAALIAEPAVRFVYERGSFSGLDTARVVSAFRVGLLQTPFYLGGMVFAIALAAQGRQAVLAAGGAVALIVKLVSNWALAEPLGVSGIQLGTALMYMTTCAYLGLGALRRPDSSLQNN
jgi:putative peptidoglycan lipid II flippase